MAIHAIPEIHPPLPEELVRELTSIVGPEGFLEDPNRLLVYESDGLTQYRVRPSAVLLPGDASQVARILAILHREGIPMVPRGAGTGLSGGAIATEGGVLVGTARLNRILSVDPEARRARIEPGVVNADLTRATLPLGLVYAPDPSSQSACTLGGNVAENSGGPHCLKYGVTSRYVTALHVALPSGEEVRLGGAEAIGELDLVGVFVGSEGCFGLAVEIEVALTPEAQAVQTLLGIFPSVEAAGHAVTRIMARGLLPAALEIMDQATIRAVEASVFAAGYPVDAGAALVVELDGEAAGLEEEMTLAAEDCRQEGATEVRIARDAEERAALWRGRKKAFGAMGRIAPDLLVQDATVPRSRLPEVLARILDIGKAHDLQVANVFHAGDGNLHPKLLFDRRNPDEVARVESASRQIMTLCIEAGGTITGEHGVGIDKRAYLPLVCPPPVLRAMGEVRRAFDPGGLSNPGKVLPPGWGPPNPPAPPMLEGSGGLPLTPEVRELLHSPSDLVVEAPAHLTLQALQDAVAGTRQWFPFHPPGGSDQALETILLEGASGSTEAGFGRLRDHVLGLTLRAKSGERLPLGGRVMKNVAGFDLVRLAVGSAGVLGRLESVILRLFPLPAVDQTLVWEGVELKEALAMGSRVRRSGLGVEALSVHFPEGVRGGTGRLACRLMGNAPSVASRRQRALELASQRGSQAQGFPEPIALEGPASVSWWEAQARATGAAAGFASGEVGADPSALPGVLNALPSPLSGAEVGTLVHLIQGGADLRIPQDALPGGEALHQFLTETRQALRGLGGGFRLAGVPNEPLDPTRLKLHRGVVSVFEPWGPRA